MSKKICTQCGSQRRPKRLHKGTGITEIALWLIGLPLTVIIPIVFLVPLFYSLYRGFSKTTMVCRDCDMPNMIPTKSPKGQELVNQILSTEVQAVK